MEKNSKRDSLRVGRMFALICAVCGGLMLVVFVVSPRMWGPAAIFGRMELGYNKMVVGWGKKSPVRDELVFVAIDDVSVNLLESGVLGEDELAASEALDLMSYGYPYPRQVWAMLARRLLDAGAKVVVFDMLFLQEGEGDAEFKAMLDRYPDRLVVGAEKVMRETHGEGKSFLMKEAVSAILSPGGSEDPRQGVVSYDTFPDDRVWLASF